MEPVECRDYISDFVMQLLRPVAEATDERVVNEATALLE
jgi:hypothetical protein